MNERDNDRIPEDCPLFTGAQLDPGAYRELFVGQSYVKGRRVVFPGPGALGILVAGKLLVGGRSETHRALINEMAPGAVFGFASLYEETRGARFESDIWAKTGARVLWLPQAGLEKLISVCPRIGSNVIAMQAQKIRFLNERIRTLSAPEAQEKLKRWLNSLPRCEDGGVIPPCAMSDLAKRLGIGRASLYRALTALEAAGTLRRENGRIYLQNL